MKKPFGDRRQGQQLVFLPTADADQLAACLVALANSAGGLIVLGLDADGRFVEEIYPEDAESALQHAIGRCQPPVIGMWQNLATAADQQLIGIRVSRSDDLHALDDGRILVRSGSDNRLLSRPEIDRLSRSRTVGDYEEESVPGATLNDFDPEMIDEYLQKREQRGASRTGSRRDLLFEIGAITSDGQPTVTGILLFGQNPQAFLPQSGAVFVRFPGEDVRPREGDPGYGRRDELRGPLPRIVERLWNIVWEEMRVGAVINNLQRREVTEYPAVAVREAIINAVAHRDYRIKGRRIEIRMYSNRLEVISPGGLPAYITLENLVEEHYSRNPRLVNGLYQWGYIEELGLGIDLMLAEMTRAGQKPPEFRDTGYSFTVTLHSNKTAQAAPPKATNNLNERQTQALAYVRENGSISNREYQRVCPDVSAETLRRDLADLVSKGVLLKIGSKKGTHYILK